MKGTLMESVLADGGLAVVFQPIVDLCGPRNVHSVEALIRGCSHTQFDRPDLLFEYARRKRQEGLLDRKCLSTILAAALDLPPALHIAINVHATTMSSQGFVDFVYSLLDRTRIASTRLSFEIVEQAMPADRTQLILAIEQVRAAGIRISLDDFGTGHSNFSLLMDCRPDTLKLDKCIVSNCSRDPLQMQMIEAVSLLARHSGMEIVAEGLENESDIETVVALGIRLGQGFALCRPVSLEALLTYMDCCPVAVAVVGTDKSFQSCATMPPLI